MRPVFLALALAALADPALAEPSFDCARAETAVEKEICKDENFGLGERDAILALIYAALKAEGGHDDLLKAQPAWLRKRNACGPDAGCLLNNYDSRLRELAAAAGDASAITGTYGYALGSDTDNGEAFVARMPDGTLRGTISTVSGPTYHTCDVSLDGASPTESGWTYTDTEKDFDGNFCTVEVRQVDGAIAISSENCSNYCGARGWFDETYKRLR